MLPFTDLIRELIEQGRLEEALNLAKKKALEAWTDMDTDVALMLADFQLATTKSFRGELDFNGLSAKMRSLSAQLLETVERVETAQGGASTAGGGPRDMILFFGANPFENLALELDREVREISEGLTRKGTRQAFDFRAQMHVSPADLHQMLLNNPRFVHFAGSAVVNHPDYGTGIIFEGKNKEPKTVGGELLARIFKQFPSVECVLLNTCDSGPTALSIGESVKYAIGMKSRVYDESAIDFAVAFYQAIGSGKDVLASFEYAKTRLLMEDYPDQADIPVLITDGQCAEAVYIDGESHLDCVRPTNTPR